MICERSHHIRYELPSKMEAMIIIIITAVFIKVTIIFLILHVYDCVVLRNLEERIMVSENKLTTL